MKSMTSIMIAWSSYCKFIKVVKKTVQMFLLTHPQNRNETNHIKIFSTIVFNNKVP